MIAMGELRGKREKMEVHRSEHAARLAAFIVDHVAPNGWARNLNFGNVLGCRVNLRR